MVLVPEQQAMLCSCASCERCLREASFYKVKFDIHESLVFVRPVEGEIIRNWPKFQFGRCINYTVLVL